MTEPALPADAVAQAFGLGAARGEPRRVAGGDSHKVWRLETDRGVFAVKHLNRDFSDPAYTSWYERAFQIELAAYEAGVPAPRPVPVPGTGRCLAELDGSARPVTVRVHEWVDGARGTEVEMTPALCRATGEALAHTHRVGMDAERTLDDMLVVHGGERWRELLERAPAERNAWAAALSDALPAIDALEGLVVRARAERAPVARTHRDVRRENLLITPDGPVLIDWDGAAPWPAPHETAEVALDLSARGYAAEPEPALFRAVLDGYARGGGVMPPLHPALFAPFLSKLLGWLEFNVRRSLGERLQEPADRERAERHVQRITAGLPRISDGLERWSRLG